MRWGVALNVRNTLSETLRKAMVVDTDGLEQIWVTDFPTIRYAPAVAAAIAESTSSCRIGVGLVSPILYSTTQIVQFMSTLIDSFGERFDLLLGPGDRYALTNIGVIQSGKQVVGQTIGSLVRIRNELREGGYRCSTFLGAQGPAMIRGSLKADGVLLNYSDLQLIQWALDQLRKGNQPPKDFQIGVFPPTFVGNCREFERNQGVAVSAAMVAIGLNSTVARLFGFQDHIERAKRMAKERGKIDLEVIKSLGDEILQRFAFCGTSDQLINYTETLERLGVSQMVFGPPQGVRRDGVEDLVKIRAAL